MGPGYSIGAVTHLRYAAPPFILTFLLFFFRVGLCSRRFLTFVGHVAASRELDTRTSNESRRYDGLRVHAIIAQDTCIKRPLSEAIYDSPCDMWLHQTDAIQRDFGASMGDEWMHQDSQIEDRTTEITEDRGPYDVRSCPLFRSDVDASGVSDPHRTDEK